MASRSSVVKVGGSLYDLPDLRGKLGGWLETLDDRRVLLVPGGGSAADAVRAHDRVHGLGQERAHWLALRALTLSAYFLAELLPAACVVASPAESGVCWSRGRLPILDAHAFARADEGQPGRLPHSWDVTSDSLAARVAGLVQARLFLLKSRAFPAAFDWAEAGRLGWVDAHFPQAVAGLPDVRAVNLRAWPG